MSEVTTRKVHTPEFKAEVDLEAVRGVKTIYETGREYGVHPVQVGQWKKASQQNAKTLFEGKLLHSSLRAPYDGAQRKRLSDFRDHYTRSIRRPINPLSASPSPALLQTHT